ncbi:hypothetical protein D9M71_738390 [compost metagenome]
MNITGMNTAIVVKVEAVMARATSFVPSFAAVIGSFSSSRCLSIFSITTMALSTSIPIPSARAPNVIILREKSAKNIKTNVTITE